MFAIINGDRGILFHDFIPRPCNVGFGESLKPTRLPIRDGLDASRVRDERKG